MKIILAALILISFFSCKKKEAMTFFMREDYYNKNKMVIPYSIRNINGDGKIDDFLPMYYSFKKKGKHQSQNISIYKLNIDDYGHTESLLFKIGDTIFLNRVNYPKQTFVILNSGIKDSLFVEDFIFTKKFLINLETTFYSPILQDTLYKFNFTYNDKRILISDGIYRSPIHSDPRISSLLISKNYFITEIYYDYSGSRALYRPTPKKVKW